MKWIELSTEDRAQVLQVLNEMKVHPLTIEDCLNQGQRAKIEEYENHYFIVWFMLSQNDIYELQLIVFPDTLILVTHGAPPQGSSWKEYLKLDDTRCKDAVHLLYQVLDRATDQTSNAMRALANKIELFEEAMFEKNVEVDPKSILALGKILSRSEFSIGHLPSVAKQMQNIYQFKDDLKWKMRDLHDHCERVKNWIEAQGTHITNAIDLYWGMEANKTNSQVKKLSLLASLSLPLTFWASFFGMNFEIIPFESYRFFELAIILMLVSSFGVYWFLRRKGYW